VFFDCNCMIGRTSVRDVRDFHSFERLKEEMEYFGISEALVYHSSAKEYSPSVGNLKLLEEIEGSPNIYPCWVVMPHHTHEFPKAGELIEEMKRHGVRAVKLFPSDGSLNFSLREWSAGELFSELEAHKIPTLIDLAQTSWDVIHDICDSHPNLPLIITNVNYRIDRYLYPLFAKFKNLYVELSGYVGHRYIEAICNNFGAERLLFGTRLPLFSAGPAIMLVTYARISPEAERLIAGDNLRRLLQWE